MAGLGERANPWSSVGPQRAPPQMPPKKKTEEGASKHESKKPEEFPWVPTPTTSLKTKGEHKMTGKKASV